MADVYKFKVKLCELEDEGELSQESNVQNLHIANSDKLENTRLLEQKGKQEK